MRDVKNSDRKIPAENNLRFENNFPDEKDVWTNLYNKLMIAFLSASFLRACRRGRDMLSQFFQSFLSHARTTIFIGKENMGRFARG